MLYGITLIILSIIAVPSLILAKKPNAAALLAKIVPYQGWTGFVFFIWGVWGLIQSILTLGWFSSGLWWIILWLTYFASSLVEAILGFMLGYGLISKYLLSKNEKAKEKGEQLLAKMASVQGKLGIFGIIVGLWCIVLRLLWSTLVTAL